MILGSLCFSICSLVLLLSVSSSLIHCLQNCCNSFLFQELYFAFRSSKSLINFSLVSNFYFLNGDCSPQSPFFNWRGQIGNNAFFFLAAKRRKELMKNSRSSVALSHTCFQSRVPGRFATAMKGILWQGTASFIEKSLHTM